MPKFLIERDIPGAGKLSAAELKAISQKSCGVLQGLVGRKARTPYRAVFSPSDSSLRGPPSGSTPGVLDHSAKRSRHEVVERLLGLDSLAILRLRRGPMREGGQRQR